MVIIQKRIPFPNLNKKVDADGDGNITLTDAQIVLQIVLKIMVSDKNVMNMDGDQAVTLTDAQMILKAV